MSNQESIDRLRKRAAFAYWGVVIASVALGSLYLFSPTFMPYHAAAIGREWGSLSTGERVLFRALLRVAAGGWLAAAASLSLLLIFPFRANVRWADWALPAVSLIFYLPNLYATLLVTRATPATAPWYGNAIGIVATLIGTALTWRSRRGEKRGR